MGLLGRASVPSKWSLRLLYVFGTAHLAGLGYMTYQRRVLGEPFALTWDKETGLRRVTRVEWLEQQTRAAYRRAHTFPGVEKHEVALREKAAALRAECEKIGLDYDAIAAEHRAMFSDGGEPDVGAPQGDSGSRLP